MKPRQKSIYWYPNPNIKQHSIFPCNWPHNIQAHTTMEIYRTRYLFQPIQSFLTVDSISASWSPAEHLHKTIAFNLSVFASDMPWQPLRKVVFSWQNESFVFYHQVVDLCYRNRKARTCPRKSLSLLWNYREQIHSIWKSCDKKKKFKKWHNFLKHELIMGTTYCDKWIARGEI